MIPVYTRFLSPYDYGILELITITLNILSIVLAGGVTEAVSRFYFDYQEIKDRNKVISVGLITFIILAILSFALFAPFCGLISETVLDSSAHSSFFLIAIAYMGLNLVLQLIFAYFRVTRRSISLTLASLAGLIVSLSLNILFVVVLEIGVKGILLATLITQALQVVILIPMTVKSVGFHFDFSLLNKMFRFGFPIIFSQISHQVVTASDRYFIKSFSNLTDVGLYSLAYKMGALVITFVATPFDMIWTPRRFEYFGQEEAEKNFARIFTLFIFVITLVGLYISILIKDMLKLLVTEPFWDAHKIVPIIALTYVLYSFYYHFNIGILMKKRTKLYAGINIATAILNLILNFFLIKAYSVWGAAVATLICYIFKPALTYYYSNRIHPIIMETRNIVLVLTSAFVAYGLCLLIETGDIYLNLILKSLGGLVYVLILYFLGFFTLDEIQKLKELIRTGLARIGLGSR
jgi:O-antigen/teichoic acid export membrane protein